MLAVGVMRAGEAELRWQVDDEKPRQAAAAAAGGGRWRRRTWRRRWRRLGHGVHDHPGRQRRSRSSTWRRAEPARSSSCTSSTAPRARTRCRAAAAARPRSVSKAKWDGSKLVITTKGANGDTVRALSIEGGKLDRASARARAASDRRRTYSQGLATASRTAEAEASRSGLFTVLAEKCGARTALEVRERGRLRSGESSARESGRTPAGLRSSPRTSAVAPDFSVHPGLPSPRHDFPLSLIDNVLTPGWAGRRDLLR